MFIGKSCSPTVLSNDKFSLYSKNWTPTNKESPFLCTGVCSNSSAMCNNHKIREYSHGKTMRFECFPTLITVLFKGRAIELCDIKIVLIFVLVSLHESRIRSPFLSGSRASPRVKIKKSLLLEKYKSKRIKSCIFLNSFERASCEKVWGNSIFAFCTPIRSIYRKSLLSPKGSPFDE